MRVLAFDTATRATAVALVDYAPGSSPAWEARDDPAVGQRPGHAGRLLPLIGEVLARSGASWADVDRLAVGTGPGTFTGLRIGIATAHGLARASGRELVGVCTLDSLALTARRSGIEGPLMAVIDARRNEVFAAAWDVGSTIGRDRPILEPTVLTPPELEAWATRLGPAGHAVGDGALAFSEPITAAGLQVPPADSALHRVSATGHCELAVALTPGRPDAVQPNYLRVPDAEIARRR